MKLPVYESQVRTPNAPEFSAMADMRAAGNLGDLADGLNQYRQFRQAELDEAQRTEWYKAEQGFQMDILKARTEMIDAIQNGGAYADAEAKFQKTFDDTKGKYLPFFSNDENAFQRQSVEFERAGLEGLLNIRQAVQQRRKGDAVDAANLRLADISERLLRSKIDGNAAEEAKLTGEMTSVLAGATAVGALSSDEAKMKIKTSMSELNSQHAVFLGQTNPEAGLAALESYYKDGSINAENYIRLKGPLQKSVDDMNIIYDQAAAIYGRSDNLPISSAPSRPPKPEKVTQNGVDAVYSNILTQYSAGDQFDQAGFENSIIELATRSRFLPTPISDQAASYLSLDPATARPEAMANAASIARVVSNVNQYGLPIRMNLDKDTIFKAELLTERINSGLNVDEAFKRTFAVTSDEASREVFLQAQKEATRLSMGSKVQEKSFDFEDLPQSTSARSEFKSLYAEYRTAGATVSEAIKKAKKEIKSAYVDFNGVSVRDPATNFLTGIKENEIISGATKIFSNETNLSLGAGERLVVVADSIAKSQLVKGEKPDFVIMMSIDKSEPVPVINPKTGRTLRMRLENEKVEYIKKTKEFTPVKQPTSMEEALSGFFRTKEIKEEKIK